MKLNLRNPIVFFDLETTGTNINADRIVEICYLKVSPNGNEEAKTMRINPEMHIPEQSSAIHGIYDEDVADCPTFKEVAKNVARDIEGRTIHHICIINAMYGRRGFRNMHFGIDTHCFRFLIPVRIYFQITNFNDPVCVDIGSRRLQIEENNRVFQI